MVDQGQERPFDSSPVSEGMRYGPFPPPELDENPRSAQWIMDEVGNDPHLYQLRMLRYSLQDDLAQHNIGPDFFVENNHRLSRAENAHKASLVKRDLTLPKPERRFLRGTED